MGPVGILVTPKIQQFSTLPKFTLLSKEIFSSIMFTHKVKIKEVNFDLFHTQMKYFVYFLLVLRPSFTLKIIRSEKLM